MKKIILMTFLCLFAFMTASAQDISKEVKRLMNEYETIKKDTTKTLEVRKIASFKYDALYYLTMKASEADNFTETDYGKQASALIDFVNLFYDRYVKARAQSKKSDIIFRFMNASTANPLFNDPDKLFVNAYINNPKYITYFSLDTDWDKALKTIAANQI